MAVPVKTDGADRLRLLPDVIDRRQQRGTDFGVTRLGGLRQIAAGEHRGTGFGAETVSRQHRTVLEALPRAERMNPPKRPAEELAGSRRIELRRAAWAQRKRR